MVSTYKKFKQKIGISSSTKQTQAPTQQPEADVDPTSDAGKMAKFRAEVNPIHERLKRLPDFDQKAGALLFHFETAVGDNHLANAEKYYPELMGRIDEIERPMKTELELLKSEPSTLAEWTQKVTDCEKFIAKYAGTGKEEAEAEDLLANARKQQILAQVAPRYAKQLKSQREDGEAPLNPMEADKIQGNMAEIMQLQLVKDCDLSEGEVLAIRTYTADNYKFMNPTTANQKDRPDDDMLKRVKGKTKEEKKAMAADVKLYKSKGWLDDKGRLDFNNVGKEKLKNAYVGRNGKKVISDELKAELEKEKAEFAAAVKKYKKPDFMDDSMERGLGKRKISEKTDEAERKLEQAVFDKEYEARKQELQDKGAAHSAVFMQAIKKLPKKAGNVFRGARMSESTFSQAYSKGKIITLQNFQSNSTNESVAEGFASGMSSLAPLKADQTLYVMAKLEVLDARDLNELSVTKEEEWMLLPESKFMVTEITTATSGNTRGAWPKPTKWITVNLKQQV